ncbi:DUF2920 family protein [Clostridium niameyense]|uniref:DUF2920 family protein n=1 Tax=Clostridium niameyense TaxID=1622073 RepID=UPI00067EF92E|nr:DUF2920 family protein [Clostridium niameyense]
MSKDYTVTIPGHPSVYKELPRELNIYFSEPQSGVNEETGILLFIAGFGGNATSNVYKKMRKNFADKYNLITVQCDYFGWQYMQGAEDLSFNLNKDKIKTILSNKDFIKLESDNLNQEQFFNIIKDYHISIEANANLKENLEDFNDMGIMQAIDNINAVLVVMAILEDNNLKFNKNKLIVYGNSHGAYLSYMCNAFAPSLFSLIIDNSAWIHPKYLYNDRILMSSIGKCNFDIKFKYLASSLNLDKEILDLNKLYAKFDNNCNIICFHGTTDNLISNTDKFKFCSNIKRCVYNEISEDKVDGVIFKSTNHGLDADFIKLFDVVEEKYEQLLVKEEFDLYNITYETNNFIYNIDYSLGVPNISIYKNNK